MEKFTVSVLGPTVDMKTGWSIFSLEEWEEYSLLNDFVECFEFVYK